MVTPTKGSRRRTRRRLKRDIRLKNTVEDFLNEFRPKERVMIRINPSSHRGMPHKRFYGKTGRIESKRGGAYVVRIRAGSKTKEVIAGPEHLKKMSKD